MKLNNFLNNLNRTNYMRLLITIFYISYSHQTTSSSKKSFFDLAKEEVVESNNQVISPEKNAASLNPEYYRSKGIEELNYCRGHFNANYARCEILKTCNFCDANSGCGWCNEKKICVPTEFNMSNNEMVPICQGECIKLIKIEYCYKGLFEPEITQHEINFSNYKDVLEESDNKEIDNENLFEKELEKNFLKVRQGKIKETVPIASKDTNKMNLNFRLKEKSNHDEDCVSSKADTNLTENLKVISNHPSMNYIPNAFTNIPSEIDLDHSRKIMLNKMTEISKNVFSDLVEGHLKHAPVVNNMHESVTKIKKEDMMKYLKDFVPNFEFPQFVSSDLENSIEKIKKEKLLLWLRGYSLNDDISKKHLPIYKDLAFANEDTQRKMFLDKFYKDILQENSQKIISEKIQNLKKSGQFFIPVTNVNSGKDISTYSKKEDLLKDVEIKKTNSETLKNIKVINSNYVDKKDLYSMVKKNNMRFKEKSLVDENILKLTNKKKIKSFEEISAELKNYLKI